MLSRFREYLEYKSQHKYMSGAVHGSLYRRSLWWFLFNSRDERMKAEEEEIRELEAIISRAR